MWCLTVLMQDQILGKQVPNTREGLWSINNQNYLLPDLLQQSQITDSSVNPPQVPLTCQEPQNKPLTKVRDKLQIDWIELQPFLSSSVLSLFRMSFFTTSLLSFKSFIWEEDDKS